MDKMIVTVFDNEKAAYEGLRALQDLSWDGNVVLYEMAVITKEPNGSVSVKQIDDQGPLGTVLGMATGSLIGLLGGPVGVALGMTAGTLGGAFYDLAHLGVSTDFLQEVSQKLTPGKAAVVAEVDEEWIIPVNSRMETLGGIVFRRSREDVVDAQIERDLTAIDADMAQAEAEMAQANQEAKAKLQARIDADKAKLQAARDRAAAQIEALRKEADAKTKTLQDQANKAQGERKAKLEARSAEIHADYERRIAKLQQAKDLRQKAGELAREALKP